jgi:hypothetical protein
MFETAILKKKGVQPMTNHVNKGKQRSSVGQFGQTPESAYGKSKKMEIHHQAHIEKAKEQE